MASISWYECTRARPNLSAANMDHSMGHGVIFIAGTKTVLKTDAQNCTWEIRRSRSEVMQHFRLGKFY